MRCALFPQNALVRKESEDPVDHLVKRVVLEKMEVQELKDTRERADSAVLLDETGQRGNLDTKEKRVSEGSVGHQESKETEVRRVLLVTEEAEDCRVCLDLMETLALRAHQAKKAREVFPDRQEYRARLALGFLDQRVMWGFRAEWVLPGLLGLASRANRGHRGRRVCQERRALQERVYQDQRVRGVWRGREDPED